MRRLFAATAMLAILSIAPPAAATDTEVEQPGRIVRAVDTSPSPTMRPIERRLALAVAMVCVNEAGFRSPADCALIWQTAENRASTTAGRLRWLRRHSSCVLASTQEEANRRPGKCHWTRNLTRSTRRPEFHDDGRWSGDNWLRVLTLCDNLVAGRITRRPCEGRVFSWDGRRYRESRRNEVGRLVLLTCRGTQNDGYGYPEQQGQPEVDREAPAEAPTATPSSAETEQS